MMSSNRCGSLKFQMQHFFSPHFALHHGSNNIPGNIAVFGEEALPQSMESHMGPPGHVLYNPLYQSWPTHVTIWDGNLVISQH